MVRKKKKSHNPSRKVEVSGLDIPRSPSVFEFPLDVHRVHINLQNCDNLLDQIREVHRANRIIVNCFDNVAEFNESSDFVCFLGNIVQFCIDLLTFREVTSSIWKKTISALISTVLKFYKTICIQDYTEYNNFSKILSNSILRLFLSFGLGKRALTSPVVVQNIRDILEIRSLVDILVRHNSSIFQFFNFFSQEITKLSHYVLPKRKSNVSYASGVLIEVSDYGECLFRIINSIISTRIKMDDKRFCQSFDKGLLNVLDSKISLCSEVMIHSSKISRDLITQTGLSISYLMKFKSIILNRGTSSPRNYHLGDSTASWIISFGNQLSPQAQLSYFRGILSILDLEELINTSFEYSSHRSSLHDWILSRVLCYSRQQSVEIIILSIQVLESWIVKSNDFKGIKGSEYFYEFDISSIMELLFLTWEHPSKKVNQLVDPSFRKAVQFLARIYPEKQSKPWNSLLLRILRLENDSRIKYSALNSILLQVEVDTILRVDGSIVDKIISSTQFKDAATSAAQLFVHFSDAVSKVNNLEIRSALSQNLMKHLLSPNYYIRRGCRVHILPLLFKNQWFDWCHEILTACRNNILKEKSSTNLSNFGALNFELLLDVIKHHRNNLPSRRISAKKDINSANCYIDELRTGILHNRISIRVTAFDALCTFSRTSEAPHPEELKLIRIFLFSNAKNIPTNDRSLVVFCFSKLLNRVHAALTKSCRDSCGVNTHVGENTKDYLFNFLSWIESFVFSSLNADNAASRQILGLELLKSLLLTFNPSVLKFSFLDLIYILGILMQSQWENVIKLAVQSLEIVIPVLHENGHMEVLVNIYRFAVKSSIEERDRQSQAGALLLKFLCRYNLSYISTTMEPNCLLLLEYLTKNLETFSSVESVRSSLQTDFGTQPSQHGIIRSVRVVLDSMHLRDVSEQSICAWRNILDRILKCCFQLIGSTNNQNYRLKGSEYQMCDAGSSVDCRGHLISCSLEIFEDESRQKAAVNSWLTVSEVGWLLSMVLTSVHPRHVVCQHVNSKTWLLCAEEIKNMGNVLISKLLILKHRGAVSSIHQALESICRFLMGTTGLPEECLGFPMLWAKRVLTELRFQEYTSALRRSAGFALALTSILRGEPKNHAPPITECVMSQLIHTSNLDGGIIIKGSVHALNVLRFIIQDALLASDLMSYLQPLLSVSIHGFSSPNWFARNSSMMLFSAVLQRMIGDKSIADGKIYAGVSIDVLLSRFPTLSCYLINYLRKCVGTLNILENGANVYPILVFLSRVRPSIELDSTASQNIDEMIPFIRVCCGAKHAMVREMAAVALASICPLNSLSDLLLQLVGTLPSENSVSEGSEILDNNSLHGILLQLIKIFQLRISTQVNDMESLNANSAHHKLFLVHNKRMVNKNELVISYKALSLLHNSAWLVTSKISNPLLRANAIMMFYLLNKRLKKSNSSNKLFDRVDEDIQKNFQAFKVSDMNLTGYKLLMKWVIRWTINYSSSCFGNVRQLIQSENISIRRITHNELESVTSSAKDLSCIAPFIFDQFQVEIDTSIQISQVKLLLSIFSSENIKAVQVVPDLASASNCKLFIDALIILKKKTSKASIIVELIGIVYRILPVHELEKTQTSIQIVGLLVHAWGVGESFRTRLSILKCVRVSQLLICQIPSYLKLKLWWLLVLALQDDNTAVRGNCCIMICEAMAFEHALIDNPVNCPCNEMHQYHSVLLQTTIRHLFHAYGMDNLSMFMEHFIRISKIEHTSSSAKKLYTIEHSNCYNEDSLFLQAFLWEAKKHGNIWRYLFQDETVVSSLHQNIHATLELVTGNSSLSFYSVPKLQDTILSVYIYYNWLVDADDNIQNSRNHSESQDLLDLLYGSLESIFLPPFEKVSLTYLHELVSGIEQRTSTSDLKQQFLHFFYLISIE